MMDEHFSGKRKADEQTAANSKKPKRDVLSEAPRELDVVRYAESHAVEIQVLSGQVKKTGASKNVAQRIPVHMRRRALSHNVKRLPRSVRAMAEKLVGPKQKKPSRYHRRRPKNLLEEYNRRQRKHIWLETHIWHAKRFHMVERWGYKLPWKPTMKSERACYRATTNHCLIQDQSYMSCIEIQGPENIILEGLSKLTNPNTGCSFAAVSCLSGLREGHTILYEPDQYPWKCIGPVLYMWDPQPVLGQNGIEAANIEEHDKKSANQRKLWIWCNPCSFDQIWRELCRCLKMTETKLMNSTMIINTSIPDNSCKEVDKTETKPFICDKYKCDVVAHSANKTVQMTSLTGSLLRFRLTGPQSVAVLLDTLQQANIVPVNVSEANQLWWKSYYSSNKHSIGHVTQREFIESVAKCQAPSELPPRCMFSLTVRDPRLSRPNQRTKVVSNESNICQDAAAFSETLTAEVASSPLWSTAVRGNVSSNIISDHKINMLKSQKLVPGLPLELGDDEARVPVIVIQRPGVSVASKMPGHNPNLGRGSGFDLILPKGWGMAFWLALVFRGARCAGLRESECNAHEEKSLLFPLDFPDTSPGTQHQLDIEEEKLKKYNRIPPAKRPNFTKYGVLSPFICPWNLLVHEWNELDTESAVASGDGAYKDSSSESTKASENRVENKFYVLRDCKVLRRLQNLCELLCYTKGQKKGGSYRCPATADVWGSYGGPVTAEVLSDLWSSHSSAIVAVRLDMLHKGCPGQFSMICLPNDEDLKCLAKDRNFSGPVEPLHPDPVLVEKRSLKKLMKTKGVKGKVKVDRNLKLLRNQVGVRVRGGCSRDILGYLNSGGFSLGTGNGGGHGFVTAVGLVKLLRFCVQCKQNTVVLLRDNSSLQYRFARLCIIV